MAKDEKEETSLQLLQRIDKRLERFEDRFPQVERKAVMYGAAAGALSGGLVACGLLVARIKLGI